jgi:dUTP pyrophosphatase
MRGQIKQGSLTRANPLDAGQDVRSSITVIIPAKESVLIPTGLVINVPEGYVGLLWSRSGLSVKHRLEVGAGCIDSGYNGEVLVHLYNHGCYDYTVEAGDKIAQLLTLPVSLESYEQVDEFGESSRGSDGFGSSGY